MRRRDRPRALPPARAGAALLESLIAVVLLATAGLAAARLTTEATAAVARARAAELAAREADAFLHAVSLWSREDLERRLGARRQGAYRLVVHRPTPTVFELALHDGRTGQQLLRTAVYRPEVSHAVGR